MPMGDSPLPNTESSANWPGMYLNFSSSSLFRKASLKVLMSLVSTSVILSTTTGMGTYGFCITVSLTDFEISSAIFRISMFTGQDMTQRPQPTHAIGPNMST